MGSNIGNVLRIQADTMRLNKRQRAEAFGAEDPAPRCCSPSYSMFLVVVVHNTTAASNIMKNVYEII